MFICLKQGKTPVQIQSQNKGYFEFEANDCDFGGHTKLDYGFEKILIIQKKFIGAGWLSIYSFDYELDNHTPVNVKSVVDLESNFLNKSWSFLTNFFSISRAWKLG